MITIVAAISENYALGKDNKLLWHILEDLKHFKNLTSGHPIIMGRKTYESIGKPLPNRTNIVVSAKKDFFLEGALAVGSLKEALKFAQKIDEEIFIIGGGKIYEQTMDIADKLEITKVLQNYDGDTFFPKIDEKIWAKTSEQENETEDGVKFVFCTYEKRPENLS